MGWGLGLSPIGQRVDNIAYDDLTNFTSRVRAASLRPEAVVVAIDERTLMASGGMRNIRTILAQTLRDLADAKPNVVASDVILADPSDPEEDERLAAAMAASTNLILPCELIGETWEYPLPIFRKSAVALGHVHLQQQSSDGVSRQIPLSEGEEDKQKWALSLEAYSVFSGQPIAQNNADLDLTVGKTVIRDVTRAPDRPMLIRYLPRGTVPIISALDVLKRKDRIRGAAVFIGVTALSAARDRLTNSYGYSVPGVEVHAQAFETLAFGDILVPASDASVLAACAAYAVAAGLIFLYLSGWPAYLLDLLLLVSAAAIPIEAFRRGYVFSAFSLIAVAWLASAAAAVFQYFFVRRQLRTSESEKSRYQQAIHWVAHEMRSPLTAIQGSSEIMTRYKLPEEKGRQLSEMINAESKRMARMIQTFLDIERLADGQMELKQEPFEARDVVDACMKRVAPIAERKSIRVFLDTPVDARLTGDRELMEYAFYNLLTNAVKYSPAETEIHVTAEVAGGELRLAVRDQGMGMDEHELKNIFKKFYRTKRAEASGEVGTGIGLSIVEQIVTHHRGHMEVTSKPGQGSCFTIVLSASNTKVPPAAENTADLPNAETFNR